MLDLRSKIEKCKHLFAAVGFGTFGTYLGGGAKISCPEGLPKQETVNKGYDIAPMYRPWIAWSNLTAAPGQYPGASQSNFLADMQAGT